MSKVTTGTARVRLCDKEASVAHELTPHTHQNARQANGFYSGPARWSNVASTVSARMGLNGATHTGDVFITAAFT